ncbi:hypothetical protein BDZ89DRAFT_1070501 [Hymenopellis radicata]|nr:hypothetical protein BDZ89DRAFT_1070501 [Hymenopellis radicata]
MDIIKTLLRRCASQTARNIGVADTVLNLLCTCLGYISTFLATEGRRWIADALKMRIIDYLWKMDTLFHTFELYTRRASCITEILKMISIYAVHATIFYRIQTSIKRVIPEGWRSSVRCVAEAWDLLQSEMSNLSPFMNVIDKDVFRDCSLSTCGNLGARRACTGCRQVLYCSPQCQKNDWQTHRTKCSTYAKKFARKQDRGWELLIIESMLLYEVKKGDRKEWYARLQQEFVDRHPAYALRDVGYVIDLSHVPRKVHVFPLDEDSDEKYLRLSREGMVIIQWRVPWAGLEAENCIMWMSSLNPDPSSYIA